MLVIRYLVLVGGSLLALLFAVDHYFPSAAAPPSAADVDRSIIRISSARALPEKIVFDVSHSPIATTSLAAGNDDDQRPAQEALAMMPRGHPLESQPVRAATELRATKRVAKRPRAVRSSRLTHRTSERRVAVDQREFFGGW
jgi:hypothetical protein